MEDIKQHEITSYQYLYILQKTIYISKKINKVVD